MSRTKKVKRGGENPITKIINFKPNTAVFQVYDKNTKEKEEVDSITMLILDADRFSMTGYSSSHGTGYLSNFVYNSKKEEFKVGVYDNGSYKEVVTGLYQDIKKDIEDADYTKNVFGIMENGNGGYDLVNLELIGKACSIFFDWWSDNEDAAYEGTVTFSATEEMYKYIQKSKKEEVVDTSKIKRIPTTYYHKLVIELGEATDEANEAADEFDTKLQKYLDGDDSTVQAETAPEPTMPSAPEDAEADEKDDLPF
jgi:hypothetical protein